jgi:hypothetical protein
MFTQNDKPAEIPDAPLSDPFEEPGVRSMRRGERVAKKKRICPPGHFPDDEGRFLSAGL